MPSSDLYEFRLISEVEDWYLIGSVRTVSGNLKTCLHWLASAQAASVRSCLHWLGYHETVGGVREVQQDNIRINIYFFSRSGVASVVSASGSTVVAL